MNNRLAIPFGVFVRMVTKPFRWYIVAQFFLSLAWSIDQSLHPYLLKILINRINTIIPDNAVAHLSMPAFLYVLEAFAFNIMLRMYDLVTATYKPPLVVHIYNTLMDYIMGHSHGFYQHHFAGNIASKVKDVALEITAMISTFIEQFFCTLLALIIAICTVWYVDRTFALALTTWLIIFIGISLFLSNKLKILSRNVAESRSRVMGTIIDIISNMMTVRLFAGRKIENVYLNDILTQSARTEQKRNTFIMLLNALQGCSFVIFQGVCLVLLVNGFKHGRFSAGDFVLILTINSSIIHFIWSLSRDITKFTENLGNISQGLRVLTIPYDITDKPQATVLTVPYGEIVFDNVNFQYQGTEPLFSKKSVVIEAGQKVGLVGYSGSGKSTFVNLILRLFDVSSGRILIDGQNIRDVTQDSLHLAIGMIPQDTSLFNRTILENIRYSRPDASDEDVINAAQKARAHEFIITLSDGYHTMVGERGLKLSGGQRQRIAIARAILKNAPILILDEATSQLDSVTEALIQESLWELMQDKKTKTTLVIAHRLSTLLHMDRILVFDYGKIVQDGTHNELLAQEGLYKTLWEAQVGGFLPQENGN